jgi:multidrug efflux pump subunit AcrA (membrane-fusion protein)
MAADTALAAITLENLRQLLHIQTELRERAETRGRKAQRVLVGLLETFAPDEVDQRLKAGQPLDSLPVEELEQLVRLHIGNQLHLAQALLKDSQSARSLQQIRDQLEQARSQIEALGKENNRLASQVTSLEAERDHLRNQVAALQTVSPMVSEQNSTTDPEKPLASGKGTHQPPEPAWMAAWRQAETFERDARILTMISESGLARRPLVEARAAELLGIKKAGGSIQALLSRLAELRLIEIFRPWEGDGAGSGGRFPDLVRLGERGQTAYWLLTGKQPATNEYDFLLERHVSPEHTLLNLQAADMLRDAGYQVNLAPPEVHLPDGGLFKPDLVLIDEQGSLLFVEVERDTDKNLEQRQAKWRNFYQASGGKMFVVCDNRSCMRNIRSEINYCLGNMAGVVSLTNLADLQAGKRGERDSVWLEARNRG